MNSGRALVILCLTSILLGCGQKGPLVLPDAAHPRKKLGDRGRDARPSAPASPTAPPGPPGPASAAPAQPTQLQSAASAATPADPATQHQP